MITGSAPFTVNKADAKAIFRAFGWSVASTAIASAIALLPSISFDPKWIWLVPLINTVLVALKQYVADNRR